MGSFVSSGLLISMYGLPFGRGRTIPEVPEKSEVFYIPGVVQESYSQLLTGEGEFCIHGV